MWIRAADLCKVKDDGSRDGDGRRYGWEYRPLVSALGSRAPARPIVLGGLEL